MLFPLIQVRFSLLRELTFCGLYVLSHILGSGLEFSRAPLALLPYLMLS